MVDEVLEIIGPPNLPVVDATYGGGGHSRALVEAGHQVIAIDRDTDVPDPTHPAITLVHASFAELDAVLTEMRMPRIGGALFDLGVSSHQLDTPQRGFSFHEDGPLDMRMDQSTGRTAADVVNHESEHELRRIFTKYGQERFAGRIARSVVAHRPFKTTNEFTECVLAALPAAARGGRHPARRVFQALRIAVNDEFGQIEAGLASVLTRLAPGRRCVALTYHSLEDRTVKRTFSEAEKACDDPPELMCDHQATHARVRRTPLTPTEHEIERNPRARSARLRATERRAA